MKLLFCVELFLSTSFVVCFVCFCYLAPYVINWQEMEANLHHPEYTVKIFDHPWLKNSLKYTTAPWASWAGAPRNKTPRAELEHPGQKGNGQIN